MDIVVICGPNAAGKTRIGTAVAREFGLEIISADSRQVYKGLDIGSGKDLFEYRSEEGTVPCHLIDIQDVHTVYSLYHYQKDCFRVLRKLSGRELPVLMVGGTGLYIESVLKKYQIANVPEDAVLRESLMKKEKEALVEMLGKVDPDLFSRTDTSSKKRLVRALEIHEYSQTNSVRFTAAGDIDISPHVFCLNPDRRTLYKNIGARLRQRLDQGMVEEVENLRKAGVPESRLRQLGMEYREINTYLRGEKGYETMVSDLEKAIRHMAKSQITYFRGMERRGLEVRWIDEHGLEKVRELVGNIVSQ